MVCQQGRWTGELKVSIKQQKATGGPIGWRLVSVGRLYTMGMHRSNDFSPVTDCDISTQGI